MAGRVDSQDMVVGVNEYHQGSRPRSLDSQSGNDADADSEKSYAPAQTANASTSVVGLPSAPAHAACTAPKAGEPRCLLGAPGHHLQEPGGSHPPRRSGAELGLRPRGTSLHSFFPLRLITPYTL